MLGRREDAEDAAQEAFVNAFSRLNRFRGKSSFRTWLHRIAVNVCIDFLRRQARSLSVQPPHGGVNDCLLRLQVREALMQLPPNYRAALVLREVNGFTYAEIAQTLNCSIDDVKNWLYRGRKMFRERYEQ
jgi:RNA polymerase sigma-70 factor (ECF subfamily)